MGNFEKLSVVVIVVIIVMILAVAVVEWTSGPAEAPPVADQAGPVVVDPPRAEVPKAEVKRSKAPLTPIKKDDKKDDAPPRDSLFDDWKFPSDGPSDTEKKGPDSEKPAKVEPAAGAATGPAPSRTPDIPETTHVVASGETLGGISKKYYDRVSMWPVIVDANPGLRPEALRPGQTLKIPSKKGVPLAGAGTTESASAPGTKPVPGKEYTVRSNDTWERISSAAYNTSARWPEIYLKNLNRVRDQKDLPPGKVIMIPK